MSVATPERVFDQDTRIVPFAGSFAARYFSSLRNCAASLVNTWARSNAARAPASTGALSFAPTRAT
jgi:hypothetical protein